MAVNKKLIEDSYAYSGVLVLGSRSCVYMCSSQYDPAPTEVAQRSVEAVREAVGALGARQIGDAGPEAWSELADLMAHVELDVMDIYGRASAFDRSHGRVACLCLRVERR